MEKKEGEDVCVSEWGRGKENKIWVVCYLCIPVYNARAPEVSIPRERIFEVTLRFSRQRAATIREERYPQRLFDMRGLVRLNNKQTPLS